MADWSEGEGEPAAADRDAEDAGDPGGLDQAPALEAPLAAGEAAEQEAEDCGDEGGRPPPARGDRAVPAS